MRGWQFDIMNSESKWGGGGGGGTPTLFLFFLQKKFSQFSRHGVGVSLYLTDLSDKQASKKKEK